MHYNTTQRILVTQHTPGEIVQLLFDAVRRGAQLGVVDEPHDHQHALGALQRNEERQQPKGSGVMEQVRKRKWQAEAVFVYNNIDQNVVGVKE